MRKRGEKGRERERDGEINTLYAEFFSSGDNHRYSCTTRLSKKGYLAFFSREREGRWGKVVVIEDEDHESENEKSVSSESTGCLLNGSGNLNPRI